MIQGLEFGISSNKVKISRNGQFLVISGTYKPVIKIFDIQQQSIKCSRGTDNDIVDFEILTEDYQKMALLLQDRTVEIHDKGGKYFQTRIPRTPRVSCYDHLSSDLLIGSSSNEIYRLNLEEGTFFKPLELSTKGINKIIHNQMLDLVMAASDEGMVSLVDFKSKNEVHLLNTFTGHPLTQIVQGSNPFEFLIGSSEGIIIHYDMRNHRPIQQTQHPYFLPINSLIPLKDQNKLISVDQRQIRVHSLDNFKEMLMAFETSTLTNDCVIIPDSGLLVTASEDSKCGLYFVPSLGHAPK